MWCCFLANPQAWAKDDLKRLLGGNPLADSPFSHAMQHVETLVVVPNIAESVYTRLWCVAEAKMAIDLGILVKLATDADSRDQSTLSRITSRSLSQGIDVMDMCIVGIGSYRRAESAQTEASEELNSKFEGVRAATCSDPEDEAQIRKAICGEEDRIDDLILHLREHGCFDPEEPKLASATNASQSKCWSFADNGTTPDEIMALCEALKQGAS